MTSLTELVPLLYRADWRRLSLAATVSQRRDRAVDWQLRQELAAERRQWLSAEGWLPRLPEMSEQREGEDHSEHLVLLAPGGRYRVTDRDGDVTAVCDGVHRWTLIRGRAGQHPADDPGTELRGLLTPRWLLASYSLRLAGSAEVSGRPAHRVIGTPRLASFRAASSKYRALQRVEVLVDAELGILLRSEQVAGGRTLAVAELSDVVAGPPETADPAAFAVPDRPGILDKPLFGEARLNGPGWQAAGAAADAAAAAMGFAARHAPWRAPGRVPGDPEATMPPGASARPDLGIAGQHVSDELIADLQRTGRPAPAFSAELHQWSDWDVLADLVHSLGDRLPPALQGILGPDALWDGVGERLRARGTQHRTARLRLQPPGSYRIDYLSGDWRTRCRGIACDGEQTRRLFSDRVAVGPARPLADDFASVADPAWLLAGWRLSAGGAVTVAGRPGLRVVAEPARAGQADAATHLHRFFSLIEAVLDPDLGIALRLTSYSGDRPATRAELRNVAAHEGAAAAGQSVFGAGAGRGLRAVADSIGPLADRDVPPALKTAGTAAATSAGIAAAGAVALTGWLEKHRPRRADNDHG